MSLRLHTEGIPLRSSVGSLASALIICYAVGFVVIDHIIRFVFAYYLPRFPNAIISAWRDAVSFLFLLVVVGRLLQRRGGIFRPSILDVAACFWIANALFGCLLSRDIELTIRALRITYMPALWYLLIRLSAIKTEFHRSFCSVLLFVATITALVGVALFFLVPESELRHLWMIKNRGADTPLEQIMRAGVVRMSSFMFSPTPFSSFMAASALVCLAAFLELRTPVYLILVVLFSLCNLLALTRGGWLLQITGTAAILWVSRRNLPRLAGGFWVISLTILLVALAAGFLFERFAPNGIGSFTTIVDVFRDPETLYQRGWSPRLRAYSETWSGLIDHPFGYGVGMVGHIAARGGDTIRLGTPSVADSWYAKVVAETGIVGIMSYGFLALTLFFYLKDLCRAPFLSSHIRASLTGLFGVVVGMAFFAVGSNAWDIEPIAPLLWVLLGIVISVATERSDAHRSEYRGLSLRSGLRNAHLSRPMWSTKEETGNERRWHSQEM